MITTQANWPSLILHNIDILSKKKKMCYKMYSFCCQRGETEGGLMFQAHCSLLAVIWPALIVQVQEQEHPLTHPRTFQRQRQRQWEPNLNIVQEATFWLGWVKICNVKEPPLKLIPIQNPFEFLQNDINGDACNRFLRREEVVHCTDWGFSYQLWLFCNWGKLPFRSFLIGTNSTNFNLLKKLFELRLISGILKISFCE